LEEKQTPGNWSVSLKTILNSLIYSSASNGFKWALFYSWTQHSPAPLSYKEAQYLHGTPGAN
jgi:hypothetical protein